MPKKVKRKPKPPTPVETPPQTATVTTTTTARIGPNPVHRAVETFAFAGGVFLLMLYMCVEVLHAAGVRLGSAPKDEHFPWGTMIAASLLVAPKMVGRATAGRAWNKLTGGRGGSAGVTQEQETGGV